MQSETFRVDGVYRVRQRRGTPRYWSSLFRVVVLFAVAVGAISTGATTTQTAGTYINPLPLESASGRFESCPDPAIIRGQTPGDSDWYLYCTTDPRNDADRNERGRLNFRLIPTFRSRDLVNWTYVGDAFSAPPAWAGGFASLRAPEIQYFNDRYYLYFTAPRTTFSSEGGSAIGVATSSSPVGPWTVSDTPVVEPQAWSGGAAGARRWVYDPAVVADVSGQRYLFYGSYAGGVAARRLTPDGLTTDPTSEIPITASYRYEGAMVVRRDGSYYLFASATNCCRGPLTGYTVFVGRAENLLGPYRDRDGVSLLDERVGGTPTLTPTGNRWLGAGHNTVFTDAGGQDWMLYHGVDRDDPYFTSFTGFTKRPLLLDPLDWLDGWPTVRGGQGTSDTPQPAPAAQPGERGAYAPRRGSADEPPGALVEQVSDEFAPAATLRDQWRWVRPPANGSYRLADGALRLATQAGELYLDTNTAPVLTGATPTGDYIAETRLRLNVPARGCCQNFVQAGLVIYRDDDTYLKLTHVAIAETRQIEFAKEVRPAQPNYPRYGNMVLGPPTEWTYLRIAKRVRGGEEQYTAYSSQDGRTWARGGTWTHALGSGARIGLVAHGGAGFTADFDYVRVYNMPR